MEVRTRSTLIAVGGIVVVAAGAVVAWQLLSKDDGPSTDPGAARITLVASVGGEERIEGAVADRVRQVIRSRTPSKRAFDDREFGVYRPANSQLPSYVVIAGSAHDDPTVYNDVHDRDPEQL